MVAQTPKQVSQLIESVLSKQTVSLGSYTFKVPVDLLRLDGDCWYAPVVPDHEVTDKNVYYDILNHVEDDLEKQHNLDVMLVPVAPND